MPVKSSTYWSGVLVCLPAYLANLCPECCTFGLVYVGEVADRYFLIVDVYADPKLFAGFVVRDALWVRTTDCCGVCQQQVNLVRDKQAFVRGIDFITGPENVFVKITTLPFLTSHPFCERPARPPLGGNCHVLVCWMGGFIFFAVCPSKHLRPCIIKRTHASLTTAVYTCRFVKIVDAVSVNCHDVKSASGEPSITGVVTLVGSSISDRRPVTLS